MATLTVPGGFAGFNDDAARKLRDYIQTSTEMPRAYSRIAILNIWSFEHKYILPVQQNI